MEAIEQAIKFRRIMMHSCGTLDFPYYLVDKIKPGVVVHTPRRFGKSKALLWTIYERHQGDATLVVINGQQERMLMNLWQEMFLYEDPWPRKLPKVVATPDFIGPRSLEFLAGRDVPIYCDEWFKFVPEAQATLRDSGMVRGAVGTEPNESTAVKTIKL